MGNSCTRSGAALTVPDFLKGVEKSSSKRRSGAAVSQNSITVVVAAEGRTVEVEIPPSETSLKVAELLLEFPPGHFMAYFDRSYFGHDQGAAAPPSATGQQLQQEPTHRPAERVSALSADTDAVPTTELVYVLFPMACLHTRITPQDQRLTVARRLFNDRNTSPENDQLHGKSPGTAGGHSCAKSSITSSWRFIRRRGARVAPLVLQLPNYNSDNTLQVHIADESASIAAQEQGNNMQMMLPLLQHIQGTASNDVDNYLQLSRHMMVKPKPWVPSLEAIRELEQECQ